MERTTLARIVVSALLAAAPWWGTSCSSYADFVSASPEEKRIAYDARLGDWDLPGSARGHGTGRSVQVFQGDGIRAEGDVIELSGGLGMATILTEDGYALTAAHVVDNEPSLDTILTPKGGDGATVHLQWATLTIFGRDGTVMSEGETLLLVGYDRDLELLGPGDVGPRPVRVVKVWPRRDLALVKLPIRTGRWFELRENWPAEGTVVFASGNGATPYHGASAGEVLSVVGRRSDPIRIIHTSVPLALGDSGGPVFDATGRLVGIVSRLRPSRLLPWPRINHSTAEMIAAPELRRLIEEDRRRS